MNRLVVSLAILLAARNASAGESCRATALLEGDAALVDSLDAALHGRGVATTATAQCRAARVRITRQGGSIVVSVVDPDGRRSERRLADLDAAASLIASWARQDLNAPLLVGLELEPTAPPSEPAHIDVLVAPPRPRAHDPLSLVAAGEASVDTGGGAWLGARATACARLGPVCVGVTGRTLADSAHRSYDLLASLELPLAIGQRFTFVPGVGAGPGWFSVTVQRDLGATTTTTTLASRVDAHASISFAVAPHVALHAGVAFGVSPQGPFSTMDGESQMSNGEPSILFRGDVGLRIGAP